MGKVIHQLINLLCVLYYQEEFFSLSLDKLTEILASDYLNVTKEETVFEAAMLWLNHSPDRKQSFVKVSPLSVCHLMKDNGEVRAM